MMWHMQPDETKIRAQLLAPMNDRRINFIILDKNIETFLHQANLEDIRQLICVDDPVVDEKALMNKNEKKA